MKKREVKIIATGQQVAKLKKGKLVTYINPVAQERAKIMKRHYKYMPIIVDDYTLKPNTVINN